MICIGGPLHNTELNILEETYFHKTEKPISKEKQNKEDLCGFSEISIPKLKHKYSLTRLSKFDNQLVYVYFGVEENEN